MKTFKPSGVDWLGDIPAHWQVIKLKFAAKNFVDKKPYVGGVYVGMEHVESWTGKISYPEGDIEVDSVLNSFDERTILFGKLRPYLAKVARPDRVGQCSTEFLTLLPRDGVDKNFLFHTLSAKGFIDVVNSSTYGVKMPRANWQFIGNLLIPLPPLDEQKTIAAYLDKACGALDREIETQRALIDKLRVYKKSLISETVTGGLNPDVPKKFSGVDWLGDIPAHWSTSKLKFVAKCRNGLNYTPFDVIDANEGTLVLRASNIKDGKLFFGDNVYVNLTNEKFLVRRGDILICSRNGSRKLVGKCALIDEDIKAYFGAFMMVCRCESPKYLFYVLNAGIFDFYLNTFTTTTINQLTIKNFGEMRIPLPPLDEQKEIAAYLDRKCRLLDENISERTALVGRLSAYKKSLIYEVVTGKTEVDR